MNFNAIRKNNRIYTKHHTNDYYFKKKIIIISTMNIVFKNEGQQLYNREILENIILFSGIHIIIIKKYFI